LKIFIAIILNFILNINFSLFRINFYFSILGSSAAIIETVLNMDENKAWNIIGNQPKAIKDKWS
jgi:hypothetical protein